jgi:putative transposase
VGHARAQAIAKICEAKVEVISAYRGRVPCVTEAVGSPRVLTGRLGRYRRLSKDYELLPEVSEAMIYGAMVRLMRGSSCLLRRIL